jgi:hypothetical protein
MITIRHYRRSDAERVGQLIADTYGEYNLSFTSPTEKNRFLGPFQYARSPEKDHRTAIAQAFAAPLVFVAVDDGSLGWHVACVAGLCRICARGPTGDRSSRCFHQPTSGLTG